MATFLTPVLSESNSNATLPLLECFLFFFVLISGFETYLDMRQCRKLAEKSAPISLLEEVAKLDSVLVTKQGPEDNSAQTKLPPSLQIKLDFEKSQAYNLEKKRFSMFKKAFTQFEVVVFLVLGVWAIVTQISENMPIF